MGVSFTDSVQRRLNFQSRDLSFLHCDLMDEIYITKIRAAVFVKIGSVVLVAEKMGEMP